MLWDTAGQEEFDAITKAYYRGKIIVINKTLANSLAAQEKCFIVHILCIPLQFSKCFKIFYVDNFRRWLKTGFDGVCSCFLGAQACVLVFSTTDRESFQAIDSWREKVEAEVGDIPTVLVQNKIDLLEETVIKK